MYVERSPTPEGHFKVKTKINGCDQTLSDMWTSNRHFVSMDNVNLKTKHAIYLKISLKLSKFNYLSCYSIKVFFFLMKHFLLIKHLCREFLLVFVTRRTDQTRYGPTITTTCNVNSKRRRILWIVIHLDLWYQNVLDLKKEKQNKTKTIHLTRFSF